ncbi:hypothetical protein K432DRAFT_324002 [Lepidopterella palustris CBS 459.81]|uniref:DUF4604 domain-containing protein n=1 Tax=Lepidopterella palustris CBS 459.81 TaxID=1314670 RepID=A0A8E2JHJ2_9PEZI|nr:hypothetical protein K432DRAFT_324002 [Lepidopterella palustris CBS 459.81]
MSFKARNLSYDAKEPAFLRRLRGEASGLDSDRHERHIPRPKKAKQDDGDDDPTYVLEESNQTLSKAEYEALLAGKDLDDQDTDANTKEGESGPAKPSEDNSSKPREGPQAKQRLTEVGKGVNKRKAAKIVGEESNDGEALPQDRKPTKKPKKRAKAIKLSFDED